MSAVGKNKQYIVTIEGYNSEGAGVARLDGRAVFIPGTLEEEIWEIRILKLTETASYGKPIRCIKESPHRRKPECPYYPRCGGCSTMHMDYEEELAFKLGKVNNALQRIGKQEVTAEDIIGAENQLRYRNKGIFNLAFDGQGCCYGFYKARSHDLIPIEKCLIQLPLGERVSKTVCEFMDRHDLLPYDEHTGKGTVRHVFCRSAVYTKDAVACIISAEGFGRNTSALVNALKENCPELTGIVLCINKERQNTVLSGNFYTLYGEAELTDCLGRYEFRISPQAFYQINPPQAEKLYAKAVEYAAGGNNGTVLELYCGTGAISMFLSERFEKVIATEIVPEAIENAKENAERNGIENITFYCGDAAQTAEHFRDMALKPDCVVVDPPRKGMDEKAVQAVADICPERIVYVSCDPATLARDILRFNAYGYMLKEATAVDMFPKTFHVETVALLSRKRARQ